MTKALYGSLVALALVTGLAFRLAWLDARPMHHDEANQAVKFGALLEHGEYRYDASDHHGPTLYYLTLPSAWLRGQRTLAALDETTVRLVPACFGVALVLLMLPLARGLGRPAIVVATVLAAVSPALTYYSRFYIQEMAFACFSLAFLVAAGRYVERPSLAPALWGGLAAGLVMATKETWMITLPAAVVAIVAAAWLSAARRIRLQPDCTDRGILRRQLGLHLAAAAFVALLVACVFYSSFFTNPSGIADWLRSFPVYGSRGLGDGRHDEPWFYYFHLLGFWRSGGFVFTEALVLALGAVGIVLAFASGIIRLKPDATSDETAEATADREIRLQPDSTTEESADRGVRLEPDEAGAGDAFWPRAIALYAVITALIFSAIPYKTPWNLVPFYAAVVVVAGYGAARLLSFARRPFLRVALVALLALGIWHLASQAWRANTRYAADPRNPYVYAQTTTDFLRLPQRITELAAMTPDGRNTLVEVLAGPYEQWPLPWYLRRFGRVGYWPKAADAHPVDAGPILVASEENAPTVEAAVGDRYASEYFGLRPGVLLTLYVERGLWERYLAARR